MSQRARDAATHAVPMAKNAVPMAKNAVPMAKNAGYAARQSAEDALAWVAPRVQDARAWAAPHVEQAGLAVREKIAPVIAEKIAPTISSALVEAAHRIDTPAPKRRRWPRVLAGIAIVAAACSAIGAVVLRRRPSAMDFGSEDDAMGTSGSGATDEMTTGPGATPASSPGRADDEEPAADGRVRRS
jgi:hypothetical protein